MSEMQSMVTNMPNNFDLDEENFMENDSDLEAELAAITGETNNLKPKSNNISKNSIESKLTQTIAECLKDVSDDDSEIDAANCTELLVELQEIARCEADRRNDEDNRSKSHNQEILLCTDLNMVDLLKKRIEMYKTAEANAKAANENFKIRRFNRGLKTLYDLLNQINAGKVINLNDIPPEVSVKVAYSDIDLEHKADNFFTLPRSEAQNPYKKEIKNATQAEKVLPSTNIQVNPLLQQMLLRQQEYKDATLQLKRSGDSVMAMQFLKIVKQFDIVIKMIEDGQDVDLSDMPPPPNKFKEYLDNKPTESGLKFANVASPKVSTLVSENESTKGENINPTKMIEALMQRLSKYKSIEESANAEENYSKARRYGRIAKQYEDAIKDIKNGRPVAYDDLPVPPGFGVLPCETLITSKVESEPSNVPKMLTTKSKINSTRHVDLAKRTSGNEQKNNLAEYQMTLVLERQNEFKVAAIEAKKAGDINQAKEYLKIYKGFNALLNAASSGLPVDLNTLPLLPSHADGLEASFAVINTEDCDENDDISGMVVRIEEQLVKQLMLCKNIRDNHKALGDIGGMNRFENLASTVQKDLDLVRYLKCKNFPLPKFRYEKRIFNIMRCNTDLNDNELEIVVVRGINYKVSNPKEVDTYVKVEFPLLNNDILRTKTNLIKDTDSPNYDQHFRVEILREHRQFQRIFKRQSAKFEVYSRGGFLRSDTKIGSVNVKLQPLETKCDIHDTFDLIEGRKKVGGKLEIKLRVRNPILTKQMERIDEKWLVTDI